MLMNTIYHIPGCPCTLALLSDSHNRPPAPILASLRAHHPSLILIAGDFVYGNVPSTPSAPDQLKMEESSNAMALLRGCASLAPTYISLGNHEWMLSLSDRRMIADAGAVVLDNSFTTTVVDGKKIVIGGLTSARVTEYQSWRRTQHTDELYPKPTSRSATPASPPQPDLSWLDDFCSVPGYHVLLSHHPEYWPLLRSRSIDLVLSGHAHGGQWRVFNPFKKEWVGWFSPGQGFWPKLTSGVHEGRLIISRGLSNTTVIPRICNPPELVFVEPE